MARWPSIAMFFMFFLTLYLGLNIKYSGGGYELIPRQIRFRIREETVCRNKVALCLFVLSVLFFIFGFVFAFVFSGA